METARKLIERAFKKAGITTLNESPSSLESKDALADMISMLSSWSNDSTLTVYRVWENFNLSAGKLEYSIGPNNTGLPDDESGIDFVTNRPIDIKAATVKFSNIDYDLSIVSDETYVNGIPLKTTQGIPSLLNYDNSYPIAKIKLFPVPSSNYSLFLLSEKNLGEVTSLDSAIEFPPGWTDAIIYNLAMRLAPEYGQPVTPELKLFADQALANIRRAVLKNRSLDVGVGNRKQNVYDGWTR